jgi:hypothetical protein
MHVKNIIPLLAVALGGLFSNCNAQSGFTITGTADNAASGKAYLIAGVETGNRDTIATAALSGGAFTLSGRTDTLQMVALVVVVDGQERRRAVSPIFLENAAFTDATYN